MSARLPPRKSKRPPPRRGARDTASKVWAAGIDASPEDVEIDGQGDVEVLRRESLTAFGGIVDAIAAAEADDDADAADAFVVVEEDSIGSRGVSIDRPPAAVRKPKVKLSKAWRLSEVERAKHAEDFKEEPSVSGSDEDAFEQVDLADCYSRDAAETTEERQMRLFKNACWQELCALAEGGAAENTEPGGNIVVGFRIRPPRAIENPEDEPATVVESSSTVRVTNVLGGNEESTFSFDHVFGGASTQFDVFRALGWPCVKNAWSGYNISIFAYGQTGSGKSHSMMGTESNPGLIRSCGDFVFDFIRRSGGGGGSVQVSCMEIYNEQIRDILAPFMEKGGPIGLAGPRASMARRAVKAAKALRVKSGDSLKIRETPTKGIYVEGLCACPVESTTELEQCITGASGHRETRATNMNAESSRSHLIFALDLEVPQMQAASANAAALQKKKRRSSLSRAADALASAVFGASTASSASSSSSSGKRAKLNMIDLAGSERSKSTGATGVSLKEGANINKSLSTLGRVIAALANPSGKQLAPFRDSKLTHILKDALVGNSVTSMLAAAHASASYYEETLSTLRYAASIKKIKTKATATGGGGDSAPSAAAMAALQEEVDALKAQLRAAQMDAAHLRPSAGQRSSQRVSFFGALPPLQLVAQPQGSAPPTSANSANGRRRSTLDGPVARKSSRLSRIGALDAIAARIEPEPPPPRKSIFGWGQVEDELALLLWQKEELEVQLALRNKEAVGFELRLLFCTKELRRSDAAMDAQVDDFDLEVNDLVAQLEASQVGNAQLLAETARLSALLPPRGASGGTDSQASLAAARSTAGSSLDARCFVDPHENDGSAYVAPAPGSMDSENHAVAL